MADLSVPVPQDLADYIESQVATGYFADAEEFVSRLLQYDREQHGRLRELLAEGERSGPSDRTFDQIIEGARERARSRAA